jgi:hypothetical protein
MANELVKYIPLETKLAVLDELFPARREAPALTRKEKKALALRERLNRELRECLGLNSVTGSGGGAVCTCGPGGVVDLPRVCAVHDKPYVARYVMGTDGRFRHAQTIKVTRALWRGQYEGNENRCRVPNADLDDECCAWCGAHGPGPVFCPTCNAEICYGLTAERYFRCRKSCKNEGRLGRPTATIQEGLRPEIGGE